MRPPVQRVPTGDYLRQPALFAARPSYVPILKPKTVQLNTHSLMQQVPQPFHQHQALPLVHVSHYRETTPFGNFTKQGMVPFLGTRPKILSTRIARSQM